MCFLSGQSKIQQGFLKDGYELISEALNLLNNVYGAMHPEIAQCLRMLARLNYIMGDHVEAMACQQKAVLMSERVNGLEHPYTITEYTHLALYCFANTQVQGQLLWCHSCFFMPPLTVIIPFYTVCRYRYRYLPSLPFFLQVRFLWSHWS